MKISYVELNESELELLILVLEIDRVQYDGILKDYELEMVSMYNRLINKLKLYKKVKYGE